MYDSVIRRSHRGLVADCFVEAFGQSVVSDALSDTDLAALLRLQGRVDANFGLYVLAFPDTELTAEAVRELYAATATKAVERLHANPDTSVKALLVDALLVGLYLYPDAVMEVERFVFGCIDSPAIDWLSQHVAIKAIGKISSLLQNPRAAGYAANKLCDWTASMAPDGSWPGISDEEAIGRAMILVDVAIPGLVVRAGVIDRCYERYVMKKSRDITDLARIEARCLHYTDIEIDYADSDIATLKEFLSSSLGYAERLNVLCTLYGVLLQPYRFEAEPYGIMPVSVRRLYNAVLESGGYHAMTDDDLLSIAAIAEELTDTLFSSEYDSVYLEELAISANLTDLCDELSIRAHRPNLAVDTRKRFLELMEAIGYGPDADGTAYPRA